MKTRMLWVLGAVALSSVSLAAPIFYANNNTPGGDWQNWCAHFDQANSVSSGRYAVSGGFLNLTSGAATDALASAREFNERVAVTADVKITTVSAGGFFTLGLAGSTAGGSQVDCDLYAESGVIKIGVYAGGSYGTSGVALSPQPTVGTVYRMGLIRSNNIVSISFKTLDGLTTLASTTRDLTAAPPTAFGLLYLKSSNITLSIDALQAADLNTGKVTLVDDFSGSAVNLANWAGEPNPDVNEGGSGGMRMFNFGAGPAQIGASRPDFQTTGFLTLRGGNPAGLGGEFYSRVPTRFAPPAYPWFGDVDVLCRIKAEAGATQFSIALDNRTNEGTRYGAVLDCQAATPRLFFASCGGATGYGSASAIAWTPIGTPQNINGWDPATEELVIYIRRSGSNFSAWVSKLMDGSVLPGFTTVATSIPAANASGQIVLTAHRGINQVNDFAVWDANTGWTLPTPTAVSDWALY